MSAKPADGLRIAFRCDADAEIGGGHVMRCLTLANALSVAGAKVSFVAAAMPDSFRNRIATFGHTLHFIPPSPQMQRDGGSWEAQPLSAETQLADARATAAAIGESDWLIVDHYLLDARWHSAARSTAGRMMAIDDLANRQYECDIVLDQTFGRSEEDYRDLVPARAKVFAGAAFALLRPEFGRERRAALDRRQAGGPVRRILLSMGTADPGGVTASIVEQVVAATSECAIDVVLGPQATGLHEVRNIAARHSRISLHVDSDHMAELMRDADIAIGAAGLTSFERCCLGLPTIAFIVAGNQRMTAENLHRAGAVVLAHSPDEVPPLLQRFENDGLRLSMIAAAATICDGNGTQMIVNAMMGRATHNESQLILRAALPSDRQIVWLWRNDYATRLFSETTEPVPWPTHEAWWARALNSADRHILVAEMAGVPVATVRFDRASDSGYKVSINLAPAARGSGLGKKILSEACERFLTQHVGARLLATIHRDNHASRNIFEKLGFVGFSGGSDSPFAHYALAEERVE
ncbi:MAG: UDP-2,4-diacetamido-2,4,6-trideoxy-beta-L-altropyranose hydrolase [Sphingomicrobium sp.]